MRRDNGTARSRMPWVLIGLVAGGAAFTLVASKRQRKDGESRTAEKRAIESDRAREAALQRYLDRIGELLLKHHLGESAKGDSVMDIARARTLTVLRQLDGKRKGLLLRFLYELDLESELIGRQVEPEGKQDQRAIVAAPQGATLRRAYQEGADLQNAQLADISLRGVDLRGANLAGAELKRVDLRSARLVGTSLVAADLERAQFVGASLKGADLRGANLTGAELTRTYLAGVDLTGARVTDEQLAQAASLKGAVMPDGTVHD